MVSQCLQNAWLGWLAEISADVREAVAHSRHFHDDVLYKYMFILLTFLYCVSSRFMMTVND